MKTKFIEATQSAEGHGMANWGKFMVARFDRDEWERRSSLPAATARSLLHEVGWSPKHILIYDLQTGEGGIFMPSPHALPRADLDKHKIWVCPMFEPFLEWLYAQDLTDLDALPALIELPEAPFAMAGYRRPGRAS